MAYFDGIKVGDMVWSVEFGWGKVQDIKDKKYIVVSFADGAIIKEYNFEGHSAYYNNNLTKQVLFWDEVKFEILKPLKIKLNEDKYLIDLSDCKVSKNKPIGCEDKIGLFRNDKETAEKALKQIKRFAKLLALRDQECEESRGYEPKHGEDYYVIGYFYTSKKWEPYTNYTAKCITVYFKTYKDAVKICDILNSGRFNLEGD